MAKINKTFRIFFVKCRNKKKRAVFWQNKTRKASSSTQSGHHTGKHLLNRKAHEINFLFPSVQVNYIRFVYFAS